MQWFKFVVFGKGYPAYNFAEENYLVYELHCKVHSMRYIIRLIRKSLIKRPTWQSPHRHETIQPPNHRNTEKRKALSETAAKDVIEDFPKAKVLCIIDGDTVIVAKGWSQIKIRLDSIDCPEDGQYWGDTAKYGLIKLIGGRKYISKNMG